TMLTHFPLQAGALTFGISVEKDEKPNAVWLESLDHPSRKHNYLRSPTHLFEYALNNGPARISNRDLTIDKVVQPDADSVVIQARGPDEDCVSFTLAVSADTSAVVLTLTITDLSAGRLLAADRVIRTAFPRIQGLVAKGDPRTAWGTIPIEIGSTVR